MSTNRDIKFRTFWNGNMIYNHSFCLTIDGQLSVLREDGEWDLAKENEFQLMQFTNLHDKHNNPIYEGDIVIGYYGWMKGDGYRKKGFPDRVRFLFEIKWSDGKRAAAGFYLDEIGVHPDDKFATDEYFYRSVQFNLKESRECELKNNEVQWKGCNESLEIIGNIFQNPELLQQ